ncbi:MAG: auracyanin family protein [Bacteroidetes bacterium]|nr:MAG: auracyanin family protein [Bacteroidota bacterium]
MKLRIYSLILCSLMVPAMVAQTPELLPREDDFYKIVTLPVPEGITLEVGGITTLPSGDIAASTRRGDVWIIENPYMEGGKNPYFRKFASGLHEILGLAYKDGDFYMAQRGELTRLRDSNGDGKADVYESVFSWPISGHYHEYSFGPVIMPDGSMFVTANVAFGDNEWWRGESRVPWRGWTMRITPDGKMEPWATGMRSPCAIGLVDGKFFYGDNQGDWMGSGFITVVEKGDFTGHPAGLKWAEAPGSPMKFTSKDLYAKVDPRFSPPGGPYVKPENIENEVPKPLFEVAKEIPSIRTPSVWLPHTILGISTSQILVDETDGAFGPFSGQLLVGDQGQSKIDRVFLEKVKGVYQGAAFPFREGFQSGVLRMTWGKEGSLFVGETNRGWGSTGKEDWGLQRLVWTGKTPFEMKAIRAMPDGFEIEFTEPVDKTTGSDPASYKITGFIYKYHPVYGSPIVNEKDCEVWAVQLSEDGRKARIVVDSLRAKYVHEVKVEGVRSYSKGFPLLHNTGYYTLNEIPDGAKLNLPRPVKAAVKDTVDHSAHAAMMPAKPEAAQTATPVPPKPKATVMSKRLTKMPVEWNGKADYTLSIGTVPGLKYDKTYFAVKSGSKVAVTFRNNDDMPHNMVFVKPGTADGVGQAAANLGLKGEAKGYVPESADVLYHTRLIGPGASETIYFLAPTKPGVYTYVCTFPGHAQVMRGVLKVE